MLIFTKSKAKKYLQQMHLLELLQLSMLRTFGDLRDEKHQLDGER